MDSKTLICASEELPERGPGVRFEIDEYGDPAAAFAVRYRGRVYAYLNRCTHVGLELDFMPGHFFDSSGELLICATHGAVYDPASGRCAGGPCNGASLEPLPIVESDGAVRLVDHVLADGTIDGDGGSDG